MVETSAVQSATKEADVPDERTQHNMTYVTYV